MSGWRETRATGCCVLLQLRWSSYQFFCWSHVRSRGYLWDLRSRVCVTATVELLMQMAGLRLCSGRIVAFSTIIELWPQWWNWQRKGESAVRLSQNFLLVDWNSVLGRKRNVCQWLPMDGTIYTSFYKHSSPNNVSMSKQSQRKGENTTCTPSLMVKLVLKVKKIQIN